MVSDNPVVGCVELQAEDAGLWFVAKTAPEAYLQQELRRIHAVIEKYVSRCNNCEIWAFVHPQDGLCPHCRQEAAKLP